MLLSKFKKVGRFFHDWFQDEQIMGGYWTLFLIFSILIRGTKKIFCMGMTNQGEKFFNPPFTGLLLPATYKGRQNEWPHILEPGKQQMEVIKNIFV